MPPETDSTDIIAPVEYPQPMLPYRGASLRVAEAWFWCCTWLTLCAWTAFLGLWVWALVLAGQALFGAS